MLRTALLLALLASPALSGPLQEADLSARLYAEGLALQDPVLLLAAARLRKAAGFPPGGTLPVGWQVMLDSAATVAQGDETLLALIDDTAAEATKGVATGPVYRLDRIDPGATDRFPLIEVTAGQRTEVYVEPESGTDLNLVIRDGSGAVLCADTDPSPIAYCAWTQAEPDSVAIEVTNAGPDSTPYALMTN
jgi:hypothetical protein